MKLPHFRRPAEVLLVEDHPGDAYLAREGLRQSGWAVNAHHVDQGEKGLASLRRQGDYAQVPTPDLVLLDLNLPGMRGHEALQVIAADPVLSSIPVIVMSSSQDGADIAGAGLWAARCMS